MTRRIWIETLDQFIQDGTATEKRLASLALNLILNPKNMDRILDAMASEILES